MTVTFDTGSGKGTPANSSQWTEVGGIISGVAVPDHLYDCQQSGGPNLIDSIGSINLTGFGSGNSFLHSVPGWNRKAARVFTGSSGFQCFNTGDPLGDPASHSHMALLMVAADAATEQIVLEFGGGVYVAAGGSSGISPDQKVNLVQPSSFFPGTADIGTAARVMLIQFDRAHSKYRCRITEETIAPTYVGATADFNRFVLGNQGGAQDTHLDFLYCAVWRGTAAEIDDATFDALFEYIDGGPPALAGRNYWGPHYPDAGRASTYWGPHYPDGVPASDVVAPSGPGTSASFALDLQSGATMTLSWDTDIFKAYDGTERRTSNLDLPKRRIAGQAYLMGNSVRATRAKLARFAAIGAPFLVGLPFDELTVDADTLTNVVPVSSTSLIDWGVQGQPVLIQNGDDFVDAVVQVVDPTSITIDSALTGNFGLAGSRIMPEVAVFLDPQQGFARYTTPEGAERWAVTFQPIIFGYEQNPRAASASLSASTGALENATIHYINTGPAGNAYSITFVGDSGSPVGSVTVVSHAYTFHFQPGVTTVLAAAFALGSVFGFAGLFDPSATLQATTDEIGPIALSLGADKSWGAMGTGSALTTFGDDRPIWDRGVTVDDVAGDSIQSLTTIVDLGGVPINVGKALEADWGRQVMIRDDLGEPWQWLKLFLYTVRGRQKTFWLPTWANDLDGVATSLVDTYTLKVAGPSFETGDFLGWYPSQRDHIMVEQEDGNVTYLKIDSATDNHDGTISIVVLDGDGFVVLLPSDSPIEMVSWMELCRFESDDFQITFKGDVFEMNVQARVVQQ